jgi:hypothetical protein
METLFRTTLFTKRFCFEYFIAYQTSSIVLLPPRVPLATIRTTMPLRVVALDEFLSTVFTFHDLFHGWPESIGIPSMSAAWLYP